LKDLPHKLPDYQITQLLKEGDDVRRIGFGFGMVMMAGFLAGAGGPAAAPAVKTITKAEADKVIEEAGKRAPEWWDTTALVIPPTLDLSWKKVGKWDKDRQMNAYLWDVIYPNPGKWREGVKLLQHSMQVNKGNEDVMRKAAASLADMYTQMLQDYPRGAFWAKKAKGMEGMDFELVECYAKLGCKTAAAELLNEVGQDETFNAVSVKLWGEMGELTTALKWADAIAEEGRVGAAYLSAGDACRRAGDIGQAMKYYQKVMDEATARNDTRNRDRARMNLEAIKLFDTLDLGKIPDGVYKDSAKGYVAQVAVAVTVKGHRIEKVEVVEHKEKQFYASLVEVPPQIVGKQSVKGIDTTTGATITSEAIINASAKALAGAGK
jgi:uncharacterized protein with FMN-binding domain